MTITKKALYATMVSTALLLGGCGKKANEPAAKDVEQIQTKPVDPFVVTEIKDNAGKFFRLGFTLVDCRYGVLTVHGQTTDSGVAAIDVAAQPDSARANLVRKTCQDAGIVPGF